jgi:hypothetical protein
MVPALKITSIWLQRRSKSRGLSGRYYMAGNVSNTRKQCLYVPKSQGSTCSR